jgi:hypothetical protein
LIPFVGNWLLYGTGGWARGTVSSDALVLVGIVPTSSGVNRAIAVQEGWFAGVGLDMVLARGSLVDWIFGIQYQHVDLGTGFHCSLQPCIPGAAGNTNNRDITMKDDIFQFRTSLKFH